jgi:hypothetical protein
MAADGYGAPKIGGYEGFDVLAPDAVSRGRHALVSEEPDEQRAVVGVGADGSGGQVGGL